MRRSAVIALGGTLALGACGGGSTTNITVVSPSSTARGPSRHLRIPSGSMEPTLSIGQEVEVTPLTGQPKVDDIVIFHPPNDAQQGLCGVPRMGRGTRQACAEPERAQSSFVFIKRVVAGPGDELFISE